MRHAKKGRRFGKNASHSQEILRGLTVALLKNERIKTTEAKAKEVRTVAEKVITLGKKGDLAARRRALAIVRDPKLVHEIFSEIAPRFESRNGGYTRILKLGPRKGDNAPMVFIELV